MPVVKSRPEILHAIVGTAGHVDHGKTSLVGLLTGCDTDRLPEEKARGMSIDLGFAPCLLEGSEGRRVVGIVDVPGHRDFIRNMVAGASSIDVLVLVIAADDGVMPQTDEHVKIIRLLRRPQVMVALTKTDLVEPEMLELARQDVAAFLDRAGFADVTIVPVSNKTGDGISDVRDTLEALVERARQRLGDGRAFRMNVERLFSVKGYGTVVTGIPVSGQVRIGEKLELLPAGRELTVRTIQSYKQDADTAYAHCCCAINVRDIEADQLTRGMTVAAPGLYRATTELAIALKNVSEEALKHRFVAMFHSGTGAVEASVKLLDCDALPPGAEALAHVMLSEPMVLAAGDRYILRAISPAQTLGGGAVLSAQGPGQRRGKMELVERLSRAGDAVQREDVFLSELEAGPSAVLLDQDVLRQTQHVGEPARERVCAAEAAGQIADLGDGAWLVLSRLDEPLARLEAGLHQYHAENPYTWGMSPVHVCELLGISTKNFQRLAKHLGARGSVAVKHGRLALAAFQPPISAHLMSLRDQILVRIQRDGINAPARGNLMKELSIPEADMKILEKLLLEDGTVFYLDGNFMLRSVYEQCRQTVLELFRTRGTVDLGAFRDAIQSNRKMAVAMLDAFDLEGLTRRVGDGRVLVQHAGAVPQEQRSQP